MKILGLSYDMVFANRWKCFILSLPMCLNAEISSVVLVIVAVVAVVAVRNVQMLGSVITVSTRESYHVSLRPSVERHFCRRMLQGLRPLQPRSQTHSARQNRNR